MYYNEMDELAAMLSGIVQGLGILAYIFGILALLMPYLVSGYMIMCVGRKAKLDADWMPFVPIARQLYQMKIADCPWWYIFLFQATFVSVGSMSLIILFISLLLKNVVVILVLSVSYAIVNMVFTFFYYRKYYIHFGFNPNAAWIDVIWSFRMVSTVLLVFIAFSDSIRYRREGEVYLETGGFDGQAPQREAARMAQQVPAGQRAVITGISGKYAGAAFDISDGMPVVFGRSASEANIVFDKFETDISRKHCFVCYDMGLQKFIVTDCSTNGTFREDGSMLPPNQPVNMEFGSLIYLGKNRKNSFLLGENETV